MKYFRMSYEEVVFNRSYINIMLLNRAIPSYNFDKKEDDGDEFSTSRKKNGRKYSRPSKPMHSSEFFMQFM